MNISQLLASTAKVKGFSASKFGEKKFGNIYLYNKTVRVKQGSSIIEVTMMIKGTSDSIKPVKESTSRSVAVHKVMIAIHGVKQEAVSNKEIIRRIKNLEIDGEKPYAGLHGNAIHSEIKNETKFFEDKTIFSNSSGGYVIVDDDISKESEIRVWCSCSSYYWVFQYYNVQEKVDIWMKYPDKYIPKSKAGWEAFKKNKPLRNPGKHPGICKHIMLLLALLMDNNTISESRNLVKSFKANFSKFKAVKKLSKDSYDKLIKSYESDHRRKNAQRQVDRSTYGYAKSIGNNKKNQQGFMSHMKWVNTKSGGHWRMK